MKTITVKVLGWFAKNLGAKIITKVGWMAYKVYAKHTEKLWDDAIVDLKEGLEKGDFERVDKGLKLLGEQYEISKQERAARRDA